jgi:S-adenosylmethionine:diacylglycerol 3-amino-3-carboxypropyl transferase
VECQLRVEKLPASVAGVVGRLLSIGVSGRLLSIGVFGRLLSIGVLGRLISIGVRVRTLIGASLSIIFDCCVLLDD